MLVCTIRAHGKQLKLAQAAVVSVHVIHDHLSQRCQGRIRRRGITWRWWNNEMVAALETLGELASEWCNFFTW